MITDNNVPSADILVKNHLGSANSAVRRGVKVTGVDTVSVPTNGRGDLLYWVYAN